MAALLFNLLLEGHFMITSFNRVRPRDLRGRTALCRGQYVTDLYTLTDGSEKAASAFDPRLAYACAMLTASEGPPPILTHLPLDAALALAVCTPTGCVR
jgi:hypothetical protein